jgi:glycosyltransferase involved in cell wall biosynthesis
MLVGPQPSGAGGIATVIGMIASSPLAQRFQLQLVATHRDAGPGGKALQALTGIGQAAVLLGLRRTDIVALHASSGASFRRKAVVAALARLFRRPYLLHVHAGGFGHYYDDAPGWERALVRSTLAHAAVVVALSQEWERRLRAITPCETAVIPNAVRIPAEPARSGDGPPRIVALGRLGDGKGSRTLVRARAALGERHGDVVLVLAGDGDRDPILEEAHRLGVEDRVALPGWVGPAARHETLAGATVFALPSRHEGMPVALLEAFAYGLPVVASPVGAIPEIVVEDRHGFLVPPDDPEALAERLAALLDDPDAARKMGAEARRAASERYDVEIVAERLGDLIERALEQAQGKRAV